MSKGKQGGPYPPLKEWAVTTFSKSEFHLNSILSKSLKVYCCCWPRSMLNTLVIFSGIFLLGGSHLWPYLVNMGTSIIWCDSNIKVQYFSVWLWYTLCSPLMAYHHNDRLHEKVSWLLPNHIPIKLLFLFSTQLN